MASNFNLNTKNNGEWLTPPEIIKALGTFDLDPCAPINRPWDMADNHFTINDDGLNKDWLGRVWCNPPYGRETFNWLNKLAEHGDGIALIFARTETNGFHEEVWRKADAVFFFRGRINFHYVDGTRSDRANAPSCLIAYGELNVLLIQDAIMRGELKGRLVRL